jgi:hypothetical protein
LLFRRDDCGRLRTVVCGSRPTVELLWYKEVLWFDLLNLLDLLLLFLNGFIVFLLELSLGV